VFNSLTAAIDYAASLADEVFVIGGATLYEALLPQADKLYLTLIHHDFAGDTFFPAWQATDWQESSRHDIHDDVSVPFSYSFVTLVRR
jgi:dihydrofolate reductase